MKRNLPFWRNAIIVAGVHVIVLAGLARWSGSAKTPPLSNVVWVQSAEAPASEASLIQESQPEEAETPPPMEDPLTMRTPPPTEIDDSTPTPKPTSTPRPTPKPTPKKKVIAKASTSSAKHAHFGGDKKAVIAPNESSTSGSGSHSGVVNEKLASYTKMLHDRFDNEWVQPTGLPAGAQYILSVHLQIERDGRVTEFKVARSSGNVVIDESVEAAGKRVTQVAPPPAELAASGRYELNVNFELEAK
ncbi:MAG TPA: energy transducer TonB [Chthoniobacterales bacterium]